ncbi:MAG: FAD-binding oxidoreductase, partial [Janthinobacterium lividum]
MLLNARSDAYASATRPHNSSTVQRPARVAAISRPEDVPAALEEVAALSRTEKRSFEVVTQATGHGAGAEVGEGVVLFDTSRLDAVTIDAETRTATVGAGATWSVVNAAAQQHGLLGLAGSAPSVSVSGYTFGGGIGWLVRRDGLASGTLRAVHYVDGRGRLRVASDDAPDELDRAAIWAFRGAGGVGIAHTLELDLVPAPDVHAGSLLWHGSALPELLAAWSSTVGAVGNGVSSSISVLHIPPAPPFPEALRGSVVVHLAIADPAGPAGAAPLLQAMRAAARPVADSWGPTNAAGLARIHLDPPGATPAIGDARWLDASTPGLAEALLGTAVAADGPLVMMELRHVAGAPTRRDGALVTPPGEFIYHSVGALGRATRDEIDAGFARARTVWTAADAGLTPGSWIEGAAAVP